MYFRIRFDALKMIIVTNCIYFISMMNQCIDYGRTDKTIRTRHNCSFHITPT